MAASTAAPTPAVRTVGLSKSYGEVRALRDLDLEVAPGEVLGYLGPNGAGKTTTIRVLLGLARPSAGRAELFGVDVGRDPVRAHGRVASVPAEANLWPNLTGAETLHLLGRIHGTVDETYRDELVAHFELDPSKKVRAYSHGNRQKVLLIGALMTRADLLILDEPTTGLDPLMEQAFRTAVREAQGRGQTVFLSSHVLSEVEALCDRVAILRRGRLVEIGRLSEMRHLAAVTIEATFAAEVPHVERVPGVRNVARDGDSLRCQLDGPIAPLLGFLATSGVEHLTVSEPSLEELFLACYGDGDGARDADSADANTTDANRADGSPARAGVPGAAVARLGR